MNKTKALMRHEILNLLTLIHFEVEEMEITEVKKESFLKHLKLLGLLVSYEDIFLKGKRNFIKQNIYLNDILEIILLKHDKLLKRRKIKLSLPAEEMRIQGDRKAIQVGLDQLFLKLIDLVKELKCEMKKNSFIIHTAPKILLDIKKINLVDCLSDKECHEDLPYHLALHLLAMNGIHLKSSKGRLEIVF